MQYKFKINLIMDTDNSVVIVWGREARGGRGFGGINGNGKNAVK